MSAEVLAKRDRVCQILTDRQLRDSTVKSPAVEAQGAANPVSILAAITFGIPALLLIPLVGMNPGVQDGTFVTVLSFLVLSAFLTAAVFEIKRLVDQPSDQNHH
jgi:hypothetical protein